MAMYSFRRSTKAMPLLITTQAAAGVTVGVTFMTCGILFATVTFRLDRDPQLIQVLSDLAWLYFTMLIPMLILQVLLVAQVIRSDRRVRPVVPSWLALTNEFLPFGWFGVLGTHCLHHGPFPWSGGITFWLTAATYFVHMTLGTAFFWIAAGEIEGQ